MKKIQNSSLFFLGLKFKILNLFRASDFGFRIFSERGFSLVEVLLTLAILAIIAGLSVTSLSNVNKDKALYIEVEKVISLIAEARSETLAAKNGAVYGVHFEERKAVLFTGASYNAIAASNKVQALNDAVKISAIALSGGGSEIVFKKLTGGAIQTGTITLAATQNASQTKMITITATGVASSN